jgi:hypothetical protein
MIGCSPVRLRISNRAVSIGRSPIASDPDEESLDDPAPRLNGKADLIGILAHNLDRDQRGPSRPHIHDRQKTR